jgi:hypothetical protein
MKKLLLFLILAPAIHAQTISPVISEGKGPRVRGEFQVTNNQLVPMAVVVQPYSMTVGTDGKPIYRPVDPGVDIKLDSNSARLSPKQSYAFGFEIKCAALPCTINFDAVLTGLHTKDGLAIALHMPSVFYLCQKQKGCRAGVRKGWGLAD